MRDARLRRRDAGYMTFTEAAIELCLPVSSIRKMGFRVIDAGTHRYILRDEVERRKEEFGLPRRSAA
jgi:hypothetical protein